MASSAKNELRCASCGKHVDLTATPRPPHFPFCSRRCQLADLGKWLDEDYRIPGDPVTPPDGGPGPDER
jgi:uncharacterized protein